MAGKLRTWPNWAHQALQGVAYWMGHRRCLFKGYPLTEGALVAEICNLIQANLSDDSMLLCEMQYADLLSGRPKVDILTERARVDLVVARKPQDKIGKPSAEYIVEVKRASAPRAQIDGDLRRLAAVRSVHSGIRAFLFVIAEAERPDRFVNEKGASRLGKHPIPKSPGHYRVRRTWKAAHAFSRVNRAQYACLLEVFG